MKYKSITISAFKMVSAGMALLAVCAVSYGQAPNLDKMDVVLKSVPDGPVAKVEGRSIARIEFVRLYEQELSRVMAQNSTRVIPDEARAQLGMFCLAALVERELLYQEAIAEEMTLPEGTVMKAWEAQLEGMRRGLPEREEGEYSEEEVLLKLGYTELDEVLADLERALLTAKMRGGIIRESGLSITDEQIAQVYERDTAEFSDSDQLHLRQIYIDPKAHPGPEETLRARAEEALAHIYSGQTFESVARTFSDAPDRGKGGDMGFVDADRLFSFMVEAAKDMAPGDVSEVIESKFGLHVFMLVERRAAGGITLEDATPLIRRQLLNDQGDQIIHEHCDGLVEAGADVQILLQLEKNITLVAPGLGLTK